MSTVYFCDGTTDGFYTAVFVAYKDRGARITASDDVQLPLGYSLTYVTTDKNKADRVMSKLDSIDCHAGWETDRILRSNKPEKEQTAFKYIRLIISKNMPVRGMLADPVVLAANDCVRSVGKEIDKFRGFIRFIETAEGFYYAPYSPDNDITDLIMPHFIARFSSQKFMIHDISREYAAMYNGNEWTSGHVGNISINISENEQIFESLWVKYYDAVNIKMRENIRQMKGYMPIRYWKFLPEKNNGENP